MMHEVCFCGWSGAVDDRDPVYLGDGDWGLTCPACGHLDRLGWLASVAARSLVAEANRRRRPPEPRSDPRRAA
jgi:hypothetical protein